MPEYLHNTFVKNRIIVVLIIILTNLFAANIKAIADKKKDEDSQTSKDSQHKLLERFWFKLYGGPNFFTNNIENTSFLLRYNIGAGFEFIIWREQRFLISLVTDFGYIQKGYKLRNEQNIVFGEIRADYFDLSLLSDFKILGINKEKFGLSINLGIGIGFHFHLTSNFYLTIDDIAYKWDEPFEKFTPPLLMRLGLDFRLFRTIISLELAGLFELYDNKHREAVLDLFVLHNNMKPVKINPNKFIGLQLNFIYKIPFSIFTKSK